MIQRQYIKYKYIKPTSVNINNNRLSTLSHSVCFVPKLVRYTWRFIFVLLFLLCWTYTLAWLFVSKKYMYLHSFIYLFFFEYLLFVFVLLLLEGFISAARCLLFCEYEQTTYKPLSPVQILKEEKNNMGRSSLLQILIRTMMENFRK